MVSTAFAETVVEGVLNGEPQITHDFLEYEGQIYEFERIESETGCEVIVKDEEGNTVVTANRNANKGMKLTENGETVVIPFEEVKEMQPMATGTWSKGETYKWHVGKVTSTIGIATAIACSMSGISLPAALKLAATFVNEQIKDLWAKTKIQWKFDDKYQYCRRTTNFYSNEACTKKVAGPITTEQKKAKDAA